MSDPTAAQRLWIPSPYTRTNIMYAANLVTPHPNCTSTEPRLPFLDVANLSPSPRASAESDLARADTLSHIVAKTLWYKSNYGGRHTLDQELTSPDQVTNCYGYSTVLSECLDEAQIGHYFVFANSHTFLVVNAATAPHLIDPLTPSLNSELATTLPTKQARELPTTVANAGRAAIVFNSSVFLDRLKSTEPADVVKQKNVWLSHGDKLYSNPNLQAYPNAELRKHKLIASFYDSLIGRQAIADYTSLSYAIGHDSRQDVLYFVDQLEGLYPELDYRNNDPFLRTYIRALAARDDVESALHIVDTMQTSFDITGYEKSIAWRPDQYRHIGGIVGSQELLDSAISLYEDLVARGAHEAFIKGKIQKTERIKAHLGSNGKPQAQAA